MRLCHLGFLENLSEFMLPKDPAALAFYPQAKRQSEWILIKWNIFIYANQPGSGQIVGLQYVLLSNVRRSQVPTLTFTTHEMGSAKFRNTTPPVLIGSPELPQIHLVFATRGTDRLLVPSEFPFISSLQEITFAYEGQVLCEVLDS